MSVTQSFIPGPRLIDGSDLNTLVAQINTALAAAGGTVTSVSVVTANGLSGTVATPTTTPAITLSIGTVSTVVSFSNASVSMTALPTADPHVVGRLWANSGVVTVSAG